MNKKMKLLRVVQNAKLIAVFNNKISKKKFSFFIKGEMFINLFWKNKNYLNFLKNKYLYLDEINLKQNVCFVLINLYFINFNQIIIYLNIYKIKLLNIYKIYLIKLNFFFNFYFLNLLKFIVYIIKKILKIKLWLKVEKI